MTGNANAARVLAGEEVTFRDLKAQAGTAQLSSLRQGRPEGANASHLDVTRDLKRINTHLVAGAAYPVLTADGALLPSRLRGEPDLA